MNKKTSLKISLASLAALSFAFYSIITVREARRQLPELVAAEKNRIQMPVTTADIGEARLKALIKIQDPGFYAHGGTDLLNGTVTTITQSLVKHLFFENFKPGVAKIKQSLIASYVVDPAVSKNEQLYLFLNLVYLGSYQGIQVRGFGQAADRYFHKSPRDLANQEYLSLLAMLTNPNELHVLLHPDKNAAKVREIIQRLPDRENAAP